MKQIVHSDFAPKAIGPYSQAVVVENSQLVYLSGQIPLDPQTMTLVEGDIAVQTERVIKNILAVCEAANGDLSNIVKLTIFLTDLSHFQRVNDVMSRYFEEPYPARSTIQVSALPKGASIEIEAVMAV